MHLAVRLSQILTLQDPLSALCAEGLALELLSETLRIEDNSEPAWLRMTRDIIHDRFRENLTLSELASLASVHPVYLARAFRQRFRCTVGDVIRNLRIEAATHELTHSERPIAEIAARNGFTDQSHLCRLLKRHSGVSPGALRRSNTQVH